MKGIYFDNSFWRLDLLILSNNVYVFDEKLKMITNIRMRGNEHERNR